MARPQKKGLEYFPFDVDFFEDDKIVCIAGEYGLKGETTAVKLLCAIYRNGYFIEWNELIRAKMLRCLPGVSSALLDCIVERLVKWGFFDASLFSSSHILTSREIQSRYFSVASRRKYDDLPYILLSPHCKKGVSVAETPVNVAETGVNVNNNPLKEKKKQKEEKNQKNKEYKETENILSLTTDACMREGIRDWEAENRDFNELSGSQAWKEQVCMNMSQSLGVHIKIPDLDRYMGTFRMEMKVKDYLHADIRDMKSHFFNWLKVQLKNRSNGNKTNAQLREERNNAVMQSVYDSIRDYAEGRVSTEDDADLLSI